jgi:8-oxo-dGTP pyrophosphatase MutT (NUDIX family)
MTVVSRVRVAAYVLRVRISTQLLIFEQAAAPAAGMQIPAGGIQPNETPQEAVLREVSEETGLTGLTVRDVLHTEERPHPVTRTPRTTTFFIVGAPTDTPDAWTHHVDGHGTDAGLIFNCRFEDLPLEHPLADDQDAGLGLIHADFITRTRR